MVPCSQAVQSVLQHSSLEDMIRDKFSFVSDDANSFQVHGTYVENLLNATATQIFDFGKRLKVLRHEVTLGKEVRQASFKLADPDLALQLLELTQKNRKVYVGVDYYTSLMENLIKYMGHNAILGRECLKPLPFFWLFYCEKANALRETLELMRASGLVYHFFEKIELARLKLVTSQAENVYKSSGAEERHAADDLSAGLFPEVAYHCGILFSLLGVAVLEPTLILLGKIC